MTNSVKELLERAHEESRRVEELHEQYVVKSESIIEGLKSAYNFIDEVQEENSAFVGGFLIERSLYWREMRHITDAINFLEELQKEWGR